MASFVHVTTEDNVRKIRRLGLRAAPSAVWKSSVKGVFAMPVVDDFFVTHQWVRELKRFNSGQLWGVYFRVPDDEVVMIGHFNKHHTARRANEAVAEVMDNRELGIEVVVQRNVPPSEIRKAKPLPNKVGWRYAPGSNGQRFCTCPYCQSGTYGGAKLKARFVETEEDV